MSEATIDATMDPMRSVHRLGDLTWLDVRDQSRIVLIPLGSLEQHGPHLPLDTDTRIALAIAEHVAELRDDLVIGPTITVGASGEHAGFAGTMSIGTDALTSMLVELVRSADAFAGVVLVNGHGGNQEALMAARAILHHEGRRVVAWSPSLPGADAHAGRSETSLMMVIAPDMVRLELVEPGTTAPLDELIDDLRTDGVASVSANGVLGDPTSASVEHGNELLVTMIADLAHVIDRTFPS